MADRTRNDFPSTSPNGFYFGPNGQAFPLETGGIPSGFYFNPQTGTIEPLSTGGMGGSTQQSNPFTPAPTQSQVNAAPSQFAGTSFDPSRYLTYPGSLYGNGTGNGNPNTGMFSQQGGARVGSGVGDGNGGDSYAGPRPDPTKTYGNGYWNAQNDPQGFNHNIYANFLSQNTDISTPQGQLANILSQMLTSGEGPMRQAQQWLQQNVRPGATSMNPGADGTAIMRAWGQLNNGISQNGDATAGVGGLGNGIDPVTGLPVVGSGTGGGGGQNINQITPDNRSQNVNLRTETEAQRLARESYDRLAASFQKGPTGLETGGGGGTQQGGGNSQLDSYNNQLDLLIRFQEGLAENAPVSDALRRKYRMPSRTELTMNQQYRQQNPNWAPDASGFYGGQVPTDSPFLPTGSAPNGFNWRWYDPDGATGINPGNFALSLANAPTDYATYTNLFNTAMDPTYGNKLLDFTLGNGRYSGMFGGQGPLNQTDFQRLLSQAQSPFFGTPLGGSALGNYIASTGYGPAISHALAGTAYDPGNDPQAPGYTPPAPIIRDFTTYPGSGVAGGNNSLTMNANSQPPPTPTPTTTTTTTGDGRPPKFNDSAYYNSTL